MRGYFGRYLVVNLTSLSIKDFNIPEDWIKKHLGGRGIAARILAEELNGGEDALGTKNILIFGTGPLQGLNIAGAGRHIVMAKSPKTGTVNGSYAGGFLAQELGSSGYDGIIVRGKAKSPKYISLIKGVAEIHDASELWGKDTAETERRLKEHYKGSRVASIGPAGENLVKFSCIINDRNRAAGRPGFGAVMGSKKLKAIVIKGGIEKPLADKDALSNARAEFAKGLVENKGLETLTKYGTSRGVLGLNELGILPTQNFKRGMFEGAEEISGELMEERILVERDNCTACPIRCKRVVETEFAGEKVEAKFGGPEYETIAAFGSLCLNDNLDAIALANQKCNQYGLDTISTGNIISFLMEAAENGKVKLDLKWGDTKGIIQIIEKIAFREGIGDLIAEGIDHLANELNAKEFATMIKNQEVPMHDPRGKTAFGLSYATTPRGGQHMEGIHDTPYLESEPVTPELGVTETMDRFDWEGKPRVAKIYEDLQSFTNSLIMCAFTNVMTGEDYNYPQIRDLVKATTGLEIGPDEMLKIGERNYLLLKLHAAKDGYKRRDDGLPKRLKEPLPNGASAGKPIPDRVLQEKIDEYYKLRGFGKHGPTDQKLKDIGLSEFIGEIKRE